MKQTSFAIVAITFLALALEPGTAQALNVSTHRLVNQAAADTVEFNAMLQRQFGLLRGIREPFGDKSAIEWIAEGGDREDDGIRFFRHFHDPLRPWDSSGLGLFDSSIHWMQRDDQGWSWNVTRGAFHAALTSPDPLARLTAWENTLQGLGQAMHLVVDASVPEHTRRDAHPLEGFCRSAYVFRCYGNYEYWVSDQHQTSDAETAFISKYLLNPIAFDRAIVQSPTGDTLAPVPIARLIDTDTYTGADSNVTLGQAIGIAEISNANFFSEDTLDGSYPFPRTDRLEPSERPAPRTGRPRAYFRKGQGDGLTVDPALAECVLYTIQSPSGTLSALDGCVDENVWAETARHMLPRAVGYARGVLDYFFRGRIDVAPPGRFAYSLAAFQPGNSGAFTQLRFKVRNATPDEETGTGQMIAVVQYRTPAINVNLIDTPSGAIAATHSFAVSQPVMATLTRSFQELVFDFRDHPLPTNAADLFLTVVYRGPLGLEDNAVIVGGKDLFEPDPIDSINETDWDCFGGEAIYVVPLPAYSPPTHKERDRNGDGTQDLFGPWLIRDQLLKTYDLAQPAPLPSTGASDFSLPLERFGEYGRFMLLQDQASYGVAVLNSQVQEIPSGTAFSNLSGAFDMDGIFNDVSLGSEGQIVRRVYPSASSRGRPIFHQVFLVNPGMAACLAQTPSLTPPVTLIDGVVTQ